MRAEKLSTAEDAGDAEVLFSSASSASSAVESFLKCDPSVTPFNVLVVDDEPLVRWSVAETLEDCGYRVTQAGDALSALEALNGKGGAADLVLLDLRLPDSSDLGVLSMMRRLSPTTPVILMTAYGSNALRVEASAGPMPSSTSRST
jgi:CheY-like chemotaxis protein